MNDATVSPNDTPAVQPDPVMASIFASVFIMMIGFFIVVVSWIPSHIDASLMKNGASVEGTVVEVNEYSSRGANQEESTFAYIVNGQEYFLKEKQAMGKWTDFVPTEEGTKAVVYYNTDKPNKAVAEGWEKSAVTGYVAGGVSVVFALFIVSSTLIQSKKDRAKAK